jgi:hypothetical protein
MRCRASLARNDDFSLLSRVLQEPPKIPIFHYSPFPTFHHSNLDDVVKSKIFPSRLGVTGGEEGEGDK